MKKIPKLDHFWVCDVKRAIEAFFLGHPVYIKVQVYVIHNDIMILTSFISLKRSLFIIIYTFDNFVIIFINNNINICCIKKVFVDKAALT